jgi:hypothetical protein
MKYIYKIKSREWFEKNTIKDRDEPGGSYVYTSFGTTSFFNKLMFDYCDEVIRSEKPVTEVLRLPKRDGYDTWSFYSGWYDLIQPLTLKSSRVKGGWTLHMEEN